MTGLRGFMPFTKSISSKVNVIAWLEFAFAYYDAAIYHVNHYVTETPHSKAEDFREEKDIYIYIYIYIYLFVLQMFAQVQIQALLFMSNLATIQFGLFSFV